MMFWPLAPNRSLNTLDSFTPAVSNKSRIWLCTSLRCSTSEIRCLSNIRSCCISADGTKLASKRPSCRNSAIRLASRRSLLRPCSALTCAGFANSKRKPCSSRNHYREPDQQKQSKTLTLPAGEFIRRFLIHTLPPGFQRIRYFGFLANRFRQEKLALCRQLLHGIRSDLLPPAAACQQLLATLSQPLLPRCPKCQIGYMRRILLLPAVPPIDSS